LKSLLSLLVINLLRIIQGQSGKARGKGCKPAMVDRIYVHAPALPENSRKQSNRFSSSTHHQLLLLSLAVIIASAFAYIT